MVGRSISWKPTASSLPASADTAVKGNEGVALTWTPLPQSRVVGYKVTKTAASGVTTVATTPAPSYLDREASSRPSDDKGTTYDMAQALYVPHGFSGILDLLNPGTAQTDVRVNGYALGMASREVLDPRAASELRRQGLQLMAGGRGAAGIGPQELLRSHGFVERNGHPANGAGVRRRALTAVIFSWFCRAARTPRHRSGRSCPDDSRRRRRSRWSACRERR